MFDKKEYLKQWRLDNIEHIKAYQKEYRRKYYIANKERLDEKHKQWKKNNPGKMREYSRKLRKKKSEVIDKLKLSLGCSVCGYNKCAIALEFHHPNGDKDFCISNALRNSRDFEKVEEEMKKCILLCANCHRELHEEDKSEK